MVLLRKGPRVVRCLDRDGDRIVISVGRNRQAKIPRDRLLLTTDLSGLSDAELEAFSGRVVQVSKDLDTEAIWRLMAEGGTRETVEHLADLCFVGGPTPAQLAGLAIHLEEQAPYFERQGNAYLARSAEDLRRMLLRDRRQEQLAAARTTILNELTEGRLPDSPTEMEGQFIRGTAVIRGSW